MSLHRRNPRRDANEVEIIAALHLAGWRVWRISGEGVPDLLCTKGERVVLFEVKTRSGRLTAAQERFFSEAGDAPCFVVKSATEALQALEGL